MTKDPKTSKLNKTRERWLKQAAEGMALWFEEEGFPLPDFRVSFGFPSAGRRSNIVSESWDQSASQDGLFEIFIKPDNAEPILVAARLAHELIHISVGLAHLHNGPFRRMARHIGLDHPLAVPTPSAVFVEHFQEILRSIGPLPHAPLDPAGINSAPARQEGRHIKVKCSDPGCGYIARLSRKWITEVGPPHCPKHGQMQIDG